jgi:hypothetical protein
MVAIEGKDDGARTADEKAKIAAHYVSDTKLLASAPLDGGVYALRYLHDGSGVAVAGEDGKVRFIAAADGKVVKEFIPVPLGPAPETAAK